MLISAISGIISTLTSNMSLERLPSVTSPLSPETRVPIPPVELEYKPSSISQEIEQSHDNTILYQHQSTEHGVPHGQSSPKASFVKGIEEAFSRCGLDVRFINAVPIGEGANHLVYLYARPEREAQVVKIPKPSSLTTITAGYEEEKANYKLAKKYFGDFIPDTSIMVDPDNPKFYCILQPLVEGSTLSNYRYRDDPSLQQQFAEIVKRNNLLYEQRKASMDFVGMSGFFSWFRKQFGKLLQRKSEFEVSNVLIDKNNHLKIVDFEYFHFNDHVAFLKRLRNQIGMIVNKMLVKHYFHLDINKAKNNSGGNKLALEGAY